MASKIHVVDEAPAGSSPEKKTSKTKIVAIVIVIVLIAVGAFAIIINHEMKLAQNMPDQPDDEGGTNPPLTEADVIVVYSLIGGPIPTWHGLEYPDDGYQFITAAYIIENLSYGGGVSSNSYNFKLNVDNVLYSHSSATYSHDEHQSLVDVMPGGQTQSVTVFEVPESADASTATLVWDGVPHTGVYLEMVGPALPDLTDAPSAMLFNYGEGSDTEIFDDEQAPEGYVYYSVPVTITNNSGTSDTIWARDIIAEVDGVEYEAENSFLDSLYMTLVSNGETIRGTLYYLLPENHGDVCLTSEEARLWSGLTINQDE